MPNIGPLELIIVLVIVLLVFGPKRLPGLGRQLGSGHARVQGLDHRQASTTTTTTTSAEQPPSCRPAPPTVRRGDAPEAAGTRRRGGRRAGLAPRRLSRAAVGPQPR